MSLFSVSNNIDNYASPFYVLIGNLTPAIVIEQSRMLHSSILGWVHPYRQNVMSFTNAQSLDMGAFFKSLLSISETKLDSSMVIQISEILKVNRWRLEGRVLSLFTTDRLFIILLRKPSSLSAVV